MPATLPRTSSCLAIFDHDGVLVDTLALHQAAWLEMGRRTGLPITAEFVHATFGMTNPMIFTRLLGDAGSDLDLDLKQCSDMKEECYRGVARGQIALMAGVRDFLDALSAAGVRLAIGSSAPRLNVALTVESCGLAGRFASIVALEDIERGKPDPQVFVEAARRAGVDPARSVVFEDAPVGIQAAKAAGMRAVGLTTTHPAAALRDAGADEVVDRLGECDVAALVRRLDEARDRGR
jgi:HAD superfamily hydrolase (TIGR01509 family)